MVLDLFHMQVMLCRSDVVQVSEISSSNKPKPFKITCAERAQLLADRCSLFLLILLHTWTLRNHRSRSFRPPAPVTCSWIGGTLGCDLDVSHLPWSQRVQYVTLLRLLKQDQFEHLWSAGSNPSAHRADADLWATFLIFCPRLLEE